jgi:hypothetical protein
MKETGMDLSAIIERVAFVETETLKGYVEIGNTRELLNDVWKQIKKRSPQAHLRGSIGSHKMEFNLKRSVNEMGVEVEPKVTNRNRGEVMLVVRMRLNEGEEEREDIDFKADDTVADVAASVLHSVNMNLMRRVSMKKIAAELLRVAKLVNGTRDLEGAQFAGLLDRANRLNDALELFVDKLPVSVEPDFNRQFKRKQAMKQMREASNRMQVVLSKLIDAAEYFQP